MKKITIILISVIFVTIFIFLGWYLFFRDQDVPVAESIKNILPFGTVDNTQPTTPSTSLGAGNQPTNEFGRSSSNFFVLSGEPVAGAVVLNQNASTTIARYVDRATGHIYDIDLATLVKTKIINQTLPKIYEAYFRPDGNAVLLRFLRDDSDVVENLSLALTPPKTSGELYTASSTALRGDIGSVAVGPGNALIYALRDSSSIVSSAFNGAGKKTILTSPFKDWRLVMLGNKLIAYSKASASVAGTLYSLSASGGGLKKIIGPLNALTAISNSTGNRILYSYTDNGRTRLFAKNLTNNTSSKVSPATLAEKCIWSTKKADLVFCAAPDELIGSGEPDNWYRGLTHFSDRFWYFDTKNDIAQVLIEPKPALGLDIDAIDLKLSPNEDYLVFTNKTDLSLWALKLESF